MSIEVTIQLNCDGCDLAYPADMRVAGDINDLTQAARDDGWRTRIRRGVREDHCPTCQETIA